MRSLQSSKGKIGISSKGTKGITGINNGKTEIEQKPLSLLSLYGGKSLTRPNSTKGFRTDSAKLSTNKSRPITASTALLRSFFFANSVQFPQPYLDFNPVEIRKNYAFEVETFASKALISKENKNSRKSILSFTIIFDLEFQMLIFKALTTGFVRHTFSHSLHIGELIKNFNESEITQKEILENLDNLSQRMLGLFCLADSLCISFPF